MRANLSHPANHPAAPAKSSARAFTLTEILVVIIIIVLMLGMAMPVFRFITGSRSQAGATNQIAAFLGRCRNDAVGLQQTMGAVFYVDTTTGRTAMVEVEPVSSNVVPYNTASSYANAYPAGTYVSVQQSGSSPPVYNYYVATQAVPAAPDGSGITKEVAGSAAPYWTEVSTNGGQNLSSNPTFQSFLGLLYDRVPGTDFELLPSGIGVQLAIDDARGVTGGTLAAGAKPVSDRYLRTGAIFFDSNGRLTSAQYAVFRGGPIGVASGFSATSFNIAQNTGPLPQNYSIGGTVEKAGSAAQPDSPLYSSFGLVVYDRDAWLSQNFPADDYIVAAPAANPPTTYGTIGSSPPSEADDENWLDTNGTPLLIDRYTGTLLRSE